jgi:protein NEDD1
MIAIYDTAKGIKKHEFQAHQTQCTDIAFSPVNHLLMCSAGLDGTIMFFDIMEGKNVKKINVQSPLSAISFCPDGHTIAVGTIKGKILVYDLKDSK